MDDRTVDGNPESPAPEDGGEATPGPLARTPESAPRERGLGLGRAAGLVVLGVLAGLALGWLAFDRAGGGGASTSPGSMNRVAAGERTTVEGVDVTGDPVLGPSDAPVTIVEFSDFECPFCARFAQRTAPLLRRQYGEDLRWIFVNNPLQSIHPRAYDAGLAGECAADQGRFWEFYDAAFSGRHDLSNSGLMAMGREIGLDMDDYRSCFQDAEFAAEMALDIKEGQKFYILGTPTFFVNGRRMEGAQPPEAFAAVIDSILRADS